MSTSRVFAYCLVSSRGQDTTTQIREITAAGFMVEKDRVMSEPILSSVAAKYRPGLAKLIEYLRKDDILIVCKIGHLGRNVMDVRETIEKLTRMGVRVYCLALGCVDLSSPAGHMVMQVITAVDEFERDLDHDPFYSPITNTRARDQPVGRPWSLSKENREEVVAALEAGASVSSLARKYDTSRQTIMRIRSRTNARSVGAATYHMSGLKKHDLDTSIAGKDQSIRTQVDIWWSQFAKNSGKLG